jgi:hypothetical protein
MVQVLHLSNGETLNPKLQDESNCIYRQSGSAENEAIIKDLFIRALAREPNPKELESMLSIVAEYSEDRLTALQDVAWSILTSSEFTFNH